MSLFNELKRRNVIRVAAAYLIIGWLLAQVSTTLEAALNLPPWFDTLVVTVMLIGFPIALLISWVYELTPEGIKKEKDIKAEDSITNATSKKLNYITIVAAFAVAGMFAWQQFGDKDMDSRLRGNEDVERGNDNSQSVIPAQAGIQVENTKNILTLGIAVLPFENLSEDPNNAFFAGGVYEDVLTYLSRIVQWRVISRTSMEKIAKKGMEIKDIGKHLDVSHVLEGSVRRAGDRVRVTVQLINASNDEHVWAENYDRKLIDIFAIQTEIAEKIAQQLKTELTPKQHQLISTKPTDNIEAYDLFIKARELSRVWRGSQAFAEQIPLLEKATALDPDFVEAQVMLVQSYGRIYWTGNDSDGIYRPKAEALKNQIVAEYPNSYYAYAAQGFYHYTIERNYQAALEQLQKALLEHPDDTEILSYIASSYKRLEVFEQSIITNKKLLSLDPENISAANEVLQNLIYTNKIDEAFAQVKSNVQQFPDNIQSQQIMANIYFNYFGDVTSYLKIHQNLLSKTKDPDWLYFRLKTNNKNIEKTIMSLKDYKQDKDSVSSAFIEVQISELLNLYGNKKKSQDYAVNALKVLKKRVLNSKILENNPMAKQRYGYLLYISCLVNDIDSFNEMEKYYLSINVKELTARNYVQIYYSMALAECGDTEKAWEIIKSISGKLSSSITDWTLALDPLYQHYFSEIPEYKAMVKRLEEEKQKKEIQ